MVSGIILASGLSVRMGQCKLLMEYKNKPLIQWVIEAVETSNFSYRVVITDKKEIINLANERGFSVVINNKGNLGQSESIKLGVLNSQEADGYAFITGDQPFINSDFLNSLIKEFEGSKNKIIVPIYKGTRGNPVIFPKSYREELLQLQGDVGGRVLLKKYKDYIQFMEIKEEKLLKDIDTKEEYETLLKNGK